MTASKGNIAMLFYLIFCTNVAFGKVNGIDTLKVNTVLFKIMDSKTKQISYLFGTHHAFGKSLLDSLENVQQALASSDILIKENLNIPGQMAEDIINNRTTETQWKKYLSQDDLQFIENIMASSRVDFSKMTPTEFQTALSRYHNEIICMAKDSADGYLTLDDYIGSVAKELGLKLIGLETTEEQIELINKDVVGMPKKVHKKRLSSIIERIKTKNTNGCSEVDWYRKMDFDYKFDQPCQNSLILTDRNEKWMEEISTYLKTDNCFIVVGLSHLMYQCGLIQQLKELGYSIVPVNIKPTS